MQTNSKPEVKTRKSGVRYVEAADILNSENGRREIQKAAEYFARLRVSQIQRHPIHGMSTLHRRHA